MRSTGAVHEAGNRRCLGRPRRRIIARKSLTTICKSACILPSFHLDGPTDVRTGKKISVQSNQQLNHWRLSVAPMMD